MSKIEIRNIGWIALVAVWSFLAGAYFHLGWVRKASMSYQTSFVIGGIAMWIVFCGMGWFIFRTVKRSGSSDPAKPALIVLSFFTLVFMLIASIKYSEVQKDKFVEDLSDDFVDYYQFKASMKGIKVEDLAWELENTFSYIQFDLKEDPHIDKLMKITSETGMFEKDQTIAKLCLKYFKTSEELGYPVADHLEELFRN